MSGYIIAVDFDDAALGCPLATHSVAARPFVNWVEVRRLLAERGVL